MSFFLKARSFLRNLFSWDRVDADVDREVHSHFEMLTEENLRAGMLDNAAQRCARIELGGIEQVKEQIREQRVGHWFHSAFSDCRFALRQLRKSTSFTAVTILTLSLGIGATTAIFSFADLLLDHPVALRHLNRLVSVEETGTTGEVATLSPANFRDLRAQTDSLQSFASYQEWTANLLGANGAQEGNGVRVDQEFFATLFFPGEYTLGKNYVVILSYAFWQREFGSDRGVISKTLQLDEQSYSVVGVMPGTFQFPPGGTQFWVPVAFDRADSDRVHGTLSTVGMLKPGMALQQSGAELNTVWSGLQQRFPEANRA